MSEPTILVVKPGAIAEGLKSDIFASGIIIVETEDPASVRLLKPNSQISGMDMLSAALGAIAKVDSTLVNSEFTKLLNAVVKATVQKQ